MEHPVGAGRAAARIRLGRLPELVALQRPQDLPRLRADVLVALAQVAGLVIGDDDRSACGAPASAGPPSSPAAAAPRRAAGRPPRSWTNSLKLRIFLPSSVRLLGPFRVVRQQLRVLLEVAGATAAFRDDGVEAVEVAQAAQVLAGQVRRPLPGRRSRRRPARSSSCRGPPRGCPAARARRRWLRPPRAARSCSRRTSSSPRGARLRVAAAAGAHRRPSGRLAPRGA